MVVVAHAGPALTDNIVIIIFASQTVCRIVIIKNAERTAVAELVRPIIIIVPLAKLVY